MCILCRPFARRTLGGLVATAAAGSLIAAPVAAQPALALPGRGTFLIRAGKVLTMDQAGDLDRAAVLVRDGRIEAVGDIAQTRGATVIDAPDAVIMPGLVDTHWHMWNSIARGLAGSGAGGYWEVWKKLAPAFRPEDNGIGTRLALAEAVHGGITTVHNWSHNTRSLESAEAELAAHRESGLRGRFSFGYPQELAGDRRMDFAALETLLQRHAAEPGDGLTSLGMCVRGPERSQERIWREEWAFARAHRLPLTVHIAVSRKLAALGSIKTLAKDGLLGPDIQLVHATHADQADLELIAKSGSPVSISPWTELRVGYGVPRIKAMADAGLRLSLSIDNTPLAGNADLFTVMKAAVDLAAGVDETQEPIPARQVLEWATIGGARDLGLDQVTGSIVPGKRADLILVQLDALNTGAAEDLDSVLTHAVQPANVSLVMADGRVLKQDGRLVGVDPNALLAQAAGAFAGVRARAA